MRFPATARISLDALNHNVRVIRKRWPGMPIMAMVKANAYGHGLVAIAKAFESVDSLAVARTDEARQLRAAGIEKPLVLLEGVFDTQGMRLAAELGCELVVHNDTQLTMLSDWSGAERFTVWLKVDTGMNRLGFDVGKADEMRAALSRMPSVRETRLMTHFACADASDGISMTAQLERWQAATAQFEGTVSVANSPALLRDDDVLSDAMAHRMPEHCWLRPGIALYGISPFDGVAAASFGLKPVMNFESRLIAVRELEAGDAVGYGGRFVAERPMRVGIAAAGYGDGYPRMLPDGTPVLVDGARCALAGRVSMDMLSVDLTHAPEATVGSLVRLWGEDNPAESVASAIGTIAYELVTRVSERVHRVYE
ncbi:MAG: alanine racemase [Pseudomonadota bacterium]